MRRLQLRRNRSFTVPSLEHATFYNSLPPAGVSFEKHYFSVHSFYSCVVYRHNFARQHHIFAIDRGVSRAINSLRLRDAKRAGFFYPAPRVVPARLRSASNAAQTAAIPGARRCVSGIIAAL
jgi:hypothetical protein